MLIINCCFFFSLSYTGIMMFLSLCLNSYYWSISVTAKIKHALNTFAKIGWTLPSWNKTKPELPVVLELFPFPFSFAKFLVRVSVLAVPLPSFTSNAQSVVVWPVPAAPLTRCWQVSDNPEPCLVFQCCLPALLQLLDFILSTIGCVLQLPLFLFLPIFWQLMSCPLLNSYFLWDALYQFLLLSGF